ncbi:MAG: HAMP domain-containing histidine kinase [Proteobacteria bacterium]|nr:HAMP domain-containing histidine kinase [Pseudomonadota bacterium]
MVRRFLSRSSISNRLVGMLVVSVVIPGIVLAWYGVQAVLQEETLYEATLRERAKEMAAVLHRDLGERMETLLGDLDATAVASGGAWISDPGSAAESLRGAESRVADVLVLDGAGELRFPRRAATTRTSSTRRSGDRAYLGPLLRSGEEAEFLREDYDAAVAAYGSALRLIPGQRGRGIARLARARSLLKAGRPAEALHEWEEAATAHAGDLDLNDFPIDLLATYQTSVALSAMGRETDAADRLVELLDVLLRGSWTFGGYGETALAYRILGQLDGDGLIRLVRGEGPDLRAVRRRLDARITQQSDQAAVLAALPAIAADARQLERRRATFSLQSLPSADRTLLVADRWWSQGGKGRQIIAVLDDRGVKAELEASITTLARANPEFATELVSGRPDESAPPSPGFKVVQSLEPWLPGYSLAVTRGEAVFGRARAQARYVRLGMIFALLVIILVGIVVIGRAVAREVEIARLKSDFVSSVSHELRTPLTTIRIMAEMLALGAVPSGDKQAEYHRNIVSEAERLTRLINNVLDFARIEEGRKKFQIGMGDIGDAVYEVEKITGDYVRKEGFTLTTTVAEGLPPTAFDRDAIIQALINLMSNAVKYSLDDKRIEMGVRMEDERIVLSVQDHGPGIDPKEVPHLFEKFYRGGDHMTREVGGTGLGLSIVQHIVAAHGGSVVVKSRLGEGSRFEFALPVRQLDEVDQKRRR